MTAPCQTFTGKSQATSWPPVETKYPDDASALAALLKWQQDFLGQFTVEYTLEEKLSWPSKELAAEAYLNGTPTDKQVAAIEEEANEVGETGAETAQVIVDKALLFNRIIRVVSGLRRATTRKIAEATTSEERGAALLAAEAKAGRLYVKIIGPTA